MLITLLILTGTIIFLLLLFFFYNNCQSTVDIKVNKYKNKYFHELQYVTFSVVNFFLGGYVLFEFGHLKGML